MVVEMEKAKDEEKRKKKIDSQVGTRKQELSVDFSKDKIDQLKVLTQLIQPTYGVSILQTNDETIETAQEPLKGPSYLENPKVKQKMTFKQNLEGSRRQFNLSMPAISQREEKTQIVSNDA